ncbi:uncharacterized protein [Pleurodeles waltl]|uniref:uncharacterized protein isoform X2 n=1 Tax=Pleurodeles waltl TaxID=8319 RepID=UPI0037099856
MATPGAALLLLLPLLFYSGCTEDVKVVNALVGGTVQLNLTYSGKATGYTWTKGSQRVAEWDDPLDVTYYVTLKGRCQLNKSTGVLIITNLQETDSARYKGEALVNSQYIPSNFDLHVFPNLINPTVTCYVKGENYTIDCDHQPEPKTYSWRSQGQLVAERNTDYSLSNSGKTLILKNAKVPFQSLECVVQNPVSKKSAPVPQDCFEGLINNKENTHGHYGLIPFIVIFSILMLAVVGFLLYRAFCINPFQWFIRRGIDAQKSPEENNLKSELHLELEEGPSQRLSQHCNDANDSTEQNTLRTGFFKSWKSGISPFQWLSRRGNDAQEQQMTEVAQGPAATVQKDDGKKKERMTGKLHLELEEGPSQRLSQHCDDAKDSTEQNTLLTGLHLNLEESPSQRLSQHCDDANDSTEQNPLMTGVAPGLAFTAPENEEKTKERMTGGVAPGLAFTAPENEEKTKERMTGGVAPGLAFTAPENEEKTKERMTGGASPGLAFTAPENEEKTKERMTGDTAQDPLGSTPEREEGTKVTETEGPLLTNEDGLQYSPAVPERVMKKEGGPDTSVLAQGAWEPCLQRRVEGQSSGGGVVDDVPQEIPDGDPKRDSGDDHDEIGNHRPSSQHLPISHDKKGDSPKPKNKGVLKTKRMKVDN